MKLGILYGELEFGEYTDLIMITRAEFFSRNNISNDNFKRDIDKFIERFGIDRNTLQVDGIGNEYQFSKLAEPITSIMMKECTKNPIYRKKKHNISIDDIIEYNESIFKRVEKLPSDLRKNIKKSKSYSYNYRLNTMIPILIERLEMLFNIVISKNNIENSNAFMDLINAIDKWITNYKEQEVMYNIAKDNMKNSTHCNEQDFIFEFSKDTNSLIDSALKKCYNNQIGLTKELRNRLSFHDIEDYLECDKNTSREELLDWILYNKYSKMREEDRIKCENMIQFKNISDGRIDSRYNAIRRDFNLLKVNKRYNYFEKNSIIKLDKTKELYKCIMEKSMQLYLNQIYLEDIYSITFINKSLTRVEVQSIVNSFKLIKDDIRDELIDLLTSEIIKLKTIIKDISLGSNINREKLEIQKNKSLKLIYDTIEDRFKKIKKDTKRVYKEIREEFDRNKYQRANKDIRDALSLAIGQAVINGMYEDKEKMKNTIYYVDDINYIY